MTLKRRKALSRATVKRAVRRRQALPKLMPIEVPANVRPMTGPGEVVAMQKRSVKSASKAATAAHKRRFDAITALGCIVCREALGIHGTPAEVHHVMDGQRRIGHHATLPVCPAHHRQGAAGRPSIHSVNGCHGGRAEFERVYGVTERELLDVTNRLIGEAA